MLADPAASTATSSTVSRPDAHQGWHAGHMYAITIDEFGGPERLRWTQIPTPDAGPGELRIRTVAAGVNRADLLQLAGHYPPPPGASELLGLEVSGVIDQVGDGVAGWAVGDPAVALLAGGGYAEHVVAPAGQVIAPPPGIDLASAGGVLEVAATVLSNLDHARLSPGETFLVHGGSGGIGSFAIQYAKALGCRVATTASAAKLDHCREMGADIVLDYRGDWLGELKDATDGAGVDVILDVIGAKYLGDNISALRPDGRIAIIGMQKGTKGELNIAQLLAKRGTISAISLRSRPVEQKTAIAKQVEQRIWPLFSSGAIRLSPETRYPLSEAATALRALAAGEVTGKLILTV